MNQMMQLVVGWTLVGAFAFTVLLTCLSLPGWIRFADQSQQKKLFTIVIVQLVINAGANAAGIVRLDPEPVKQQIRSEGNNEAVLGLLGDALGDAHGTDPGKPPPITREHAELLIGRLQVAHDPELQRARTELQQKVTALPKGTLTPEAIRSLKPMIDTTRDTALRAHK